MTCPDAETLGRYAEGALERDASDGVRVHLDGCPACRELLVTLVRSSHASPGTISGAPWDVPVPGATLGRYRVTGTRGAGGMGVVLAAYDPQLDRQIALKVLRPDLGGDAPEKGRLRLVREAQLMARVRHPNVVTVHDVVVEGERVFIAMELVEGKTLRDWLEAPGEQTTPRALVDILRVFSAAGRGLSAAHDAGVVHRDFKPDNVLVDASGQVLVSDFGLAWSQTLESPEPTAARSGQSLGTSRRSAAIGTPAYMAPEQLLGEAVDARADQFSFCVALFEALHGARPFGGQTTTALLAEIDAGRLRPSRRALPKKVAAALERGLSRNPADRFPSMPALLGALEPRRRAGWPLPAAALAVTLAVALGAWGWTSREATCRPVRERLGAAWSPERRARFVERLAPSPRVAALAAHVTALAQALRPEWDAVCAAAGDAAANRRACLETRVQGLEVTAEVLGLPGTDVRASAALIARLEGPDSCTAGELVTLLPQPADAATRKLIFASRVSSATADALRLGGKLDEATAAATRALDEARRTGWRPAEADALLAAAQISRARARFKEAEVTLGEALLAAEGGRHFEAIARISVQHILVVGTQTVRPDEAEPWVLRAEAALEQLPRRRLRAEVDQAITLLRVSQGRFDEAILVSERALAVSGGDVSATADLHSLRSLLFLQFGLHHRALASARLAAEGRVAFLGPAHPLTLHALLTLGEAQARAGLALDALETLEPALKAVRARKDVSPVALAGGLVGRGVALGHRGRHAEALAATTEARALVVSLVGPTHRYAALVERAVAERLEAMGNDAEALIAFERAVSIGTAAVGPFHRETLESRAERALLLARRGDALAEAEARAVVAAVRQDPSIGQSPLVAASLALASLATASLEAREEALRIAKAVRGEPDPEVLQALLRSGALDAAEAERAGLQLAAPRAQGPLE